MQRSVTVLTMPQPFASETLSCAAKSVGRTDVVLKMTCLVLSLGLAREMYLKAESDRQEQKMIIKDQWINTNA